MCIPAVIGRSKRWHKVRMFRGNHFRVIHILTNATSDFSSNLFEEIKYKFLQRLETCLKELQINYRKTYDMYFDVSSSLFFDSKTRSPLSCLCQKLFTKHTIIVLYDRKTNLIKILLLCYWLEYDQIALKNRAFCSLSDCVERKLLKAYRMVMECHCHRIWAPISISFHRILLLNIDEDK